MEEEENTKNKIKKNGDEEAEKVIRLVVTKEADRAVSEVMDAVNTGFEAGRATKLDVASYMLIWFENNASKDAKLALRMQLANEMTMLESLVKMAKNSGTLPPALKEALAQHFFGEDAAPARKVKKILKPDGIIDRTSEEGAA